MAGTAQRLWRASSPLGWTSELGLAGAGPVAILAGFSLAAAVGLTQDNRSWAQDAALVFFTLAVAVLVAALRLIIAAQSHLSAPSDYLSWRPEAGRDPEALRDERDRQVWDYNIYMDYRGKAVKVFPIGVASALLGLAAACLNALARHAAAGSVVTGCVAAAVLLLGGVVALLEIWDQPALLFPDDKVALTRIASRVERARARQVPATGQKSSRLPAVLQPLPLDVPGLTAALGDNFITPPLLTSSSRTIREFVQFLPADLQQIVFRLACQKLGREFGGYSTTRTSVLFTVNPDDDPREQIIVEIHPIWSELDETGVPFKASPKLIAKRSGRPLAYVEEALESFPRFPFQRSGCRLLCGALSVEYLAQVVARPKSPIRCELAGQVTRSPHTWSRTHPAK